MSRKETPLAKMDALPDGMREAVFAFCEKNTLAQAVKWIGAEFDIQISDTRLSTWLGKLRNEKADAEFRAYLAELSRDSAQAGEIAATAGRAAALNAANVALLSQGLYTALRANKDHKQQMIAAEMLSGLLTSVAKSDQARAQIISAETGRDKFQFDAAKLALQHLEALRAIQQSNATDREKIDLAVTRLFGTAPQEVAS
jgi:hypothetical protein